jgi:hypothetical protein
MAQTRRIELVVKSKPTIEGAGVHLKRAFGFSEVPNLDPFLLLDDFHSDNPAYYLPGFPWHPHRGIETVTYMLEGRVEHGDSMGNQGVIEPGDVQWMTAGSGIIHQEMPQGDERKRMWGFQLWVNLPAAAKMMEPRYREVKAGQIPEAALPDGVKVKVICGQAGGVQGPVQDIVTSPTYLDITVPPRTQTAHPVPRGQRAFAYVVSGRALFCREKDAYAFEARGVNYFDLQRDPHLGPETLVIFSDGDQVEVTTQDEPVRLLLAHGRPLGEPVAWYGPIVMNTQEELRLAFQEYQDGTFLKPKPHHLT